MTLSWQRGVLYLVVTYVKLSTCLNKWRQPLKAGGKPLQEGKPPGAEGFLGYQCVKALSASRHPRRDLLPVTEEMCVDAEGERKYSEQ